MRGPASEDALAPGDGRVAATTPDASAVDLLEDGPAPSEDLPAEIDLAPDGLEADAALEEVGPVSPRCDGPCEWTPAALGARLVVWLDAAQLVTTLEGRVARWGDLSGWGNDATQSLPGRRPVLEPHDFGSRPGIVFNPTAEDHHFLNIPDAPNLRFGTDPFTLVVVARTAYSGWVHAALWSKQEPDEPFIGASLWLVHDPLRGYGRLLFQVAFVPPGGSATRTDGFNQRVPFILTGQRVDAAKIRVRVGGVEDEVVLPSDLAGVDVSAANQPVFLGAIASSTQQKVNGSYAEVIAIHGAITEEELGSLKKYLESKYPSAVF